MSATIKRQKKKIEETELILLRMYEVAQKQNCIICTYDFSLLNLLKKQIRSIDWLVALTKNEAYRTIYKFKYRPFYCSQHIMKAFDGTTRS